MHEICRIIFLNKKREMIKSRKSTNTFPMNKKANNVNMLAKDSETYLNYLK